MAKYVKHTWQSNEIISDENLNNMENGIEALDNDKLAAPTGGNGTSGQVLVTNGDGTTAWADTIKKQSAIPDAAGSDEKDKINAILAALRAAGVIATE